MTRRKPAKWDILIAFGLAASLTAGCTATQPSETLLFEGARLILGDGALIENGARPVLATVWRPKGRAAAAGSKMTIWPSRTVAMFEPATVPAEN